MTIIEALAAGRPVVATDVGGVPDVVDDGETGFLVRPGDTQAIAERLEMLARDPALRRADGCDRARARRSSATRSSASCDDVDALYRELLDVTASSAISRR